MSWLNQQTPTFRWDDVVAGRYRIECFLARGGMGEVYRAEDLELRVPVALKTIRPEIAADPAALRSFKQEVLTARSVTHPNVCRIYDLGRHRDDTRDISFLTMEFLPGETLSSRLRSCGRLSGAEALPIVQQLAEGLDAAHRAGIVHRDFKSANVILAPGKGAVRIVITDFGLAVAADWRGGGIPLAGGLASDPADSDVTVDSLGPGGPQICGTPAYMAPEQVRGERVGPAADLYALGVTLFEMRTGSLPFIGRTGLETAQLRLTTPPPRPSTIAALEPEWDEAILKLLSLDPTERFPSAPQLVRALEGRAVDGKEVRHSLPPEPDAFVGRREVLASLSGALEPSAALVTILGVGGTGKTRLARRYGWESLARWPGGVWFCDLTDARDLNGIASAVAAALDVPLAKGDPIAQLGHVIAGRGRALVILDNFEQVAAHAEATLGRWRARALETSFLVTSREHLYLEGETVLELNPLDSETEAVELFHERARAQRQGFAVTDENRAVVVEMVRMLDGLPLAIELAAARLRMLSLEQLRDRLSDRFAILTSSKRGRHATLRATLDWSWSLLTPWEQSAVAQASVFQGGFTLEAAEAVIDLSTHVDAPMVIDVVQALVDKSWLRARVELGAPRFSMYATVHEYAEEKSRAGEDGTAGPSPAVRRHSEYFATMGTESAIDALAAPGGVIRRAALRMELDNLVAACRHAIARGAGDIAGGSYFAAAAVLHLQGPASAAVELGQDLLATLDDGALRGRVLASLASSERMLGKYREARSHFDAALSIHRKIGDRRSEGVVLGSLGILHQDQGRMEDAQLHYEAALAIHREVGNRRLEAAVLGSLGGLHSDQGRMGEARSHYEGALAIQREVGNRYFEGVVLGNLGTLYKDQGRMAEARSHHEDALAIHREVGNRRSEGHVLGNLGVLLQEQGEMEEAQSRYEGALAIHREVGNRRLEGHVLGNLGALQFIQGRAEDARPNLDAALAILREVGDRGFEGNVLGNLGILHRDSGRAEEARLHLEAALEIHREVGARYAEGVVLRSLGELHHGQGRTAEARRCLDESIAILREVDDPLELALALCLDGSLALELDQVAAAHSALTEAEQIGRSVGANPASDTGRKIASLREAIRTASDAR